MIYGALYVVGLLLLMVASGWIGSVWHWSIRRTAVIAFAVAWSWFGLFWKLGGFAR